MIAYVLAAVGFALLIILHEFGHFLAAKATGMRVERFALFFPPLIAKVRRGETEYGIGAIPLGGFVKITGMNPEEKLPPDVAPRAYYAQPVWKRIVVISAGPVMNVLIAFVIFFALDFSATEQTSNVGTLRSGYPSVGVLKAGDHIVAVDGKRGSPETFARAISSHHCVGAPRTGCRARTPATVAFKRGGHLLTARVRPRYDPAVRRTLIGFTYATRPANPSVREAADTSIDVMGTITTATGRAVSRIFESKERKQFSGPVGIYAVTKNEFSHNIKRALFVLGLVSFSLALFNAFPFFPLDGGHVLQALLETVLGRGRAFRALMQVSTVGIMAVLFIAIIAFTNDVGRLFNGGFQTP